MKKTFCGQRLPAGILAMLILLGTLPVMVLPSFAANDSTLGEYVALPITIRDYAADGMLFEWNELGATGDSTIYDGDVPAPAKKFTNETSGEKYNKTVADGYVRYTVTTTGAYITYASSNLTRAQMRYAVVSYRTDSETDQSPEIGHRTNGGGTSHYVSLTKDGYNIGLKEPFKRVVIDLGSGDAEVNYVTIYPRLPEGKSIDIEYIAFFASKDDADRYANGGVSSSVYHHGGTRGYGLLQTIDKDHLNNLSNSAAISGTELVENGAWNSAPTSNKNVVLNSNVPQILYGAYVRTNLVEPNLVNSKPVYTEATVKYIAEYMRDTLKEVWKNEDGTYNMWYVMGTKLFDDNNNYVGNDSKATRDLAEVFRRCLTDGLGAYEESKNKSLTKATDCKTYYDAAYFLLSTLFSDNEGYGQTVSEYHQINLVKKGNAYVFNSAYDDSVYDTVNGVIYNSQTTTITPRYTSSGVTEEPRGNLLPENRFNPINGMYYGNNGNEYLKVTDPNATDLTKYYANTNYNLTLEGHAQFIFYEDDNMYFNFTGDDDVYLYINGIRVMDMGGAHSISKCGINLNEVKEICGLHDGEVYDFDFFYMERHGTAANFGIETNIRIVDPSMVTEKSAYQNGSEVGNGGYIDATKPVKYQYELTNNGEAKIIDLVFDDTQIGVKLTKDSIKLNSETKIDDLYAAVYDKNGNKKADHAIGTLTEAELKQLLADGLEVGDRISLFGFKYTIPDTSWVSDQFTNTVYTKAVTDGSNTRYRTLTGIDTSTVKKSTVVYEPLHYYEWAGKGVTATTAELIEHVNKALTAANMNTVSADAKISLCSASGKADTDTYKYNNNASVVSGGVEYVAAEIGGSDKHQTGASTYYYMVGECGPVSVTVYSYDVTDDKFVIDYNLPVRFDGNETFLNNDILTLGVNPYTTTATPTIAEPNATYGTVDVSGMSITYTMTSFMNGVEAVTLNVTILEDGADAVTTKTGVEMTETIYIAPANVVYYEDDFEGITYINSDGNTWEYFETSDRGQSQSAAQDTPYGSDPNYAGDKASGGYSRQDVLNAIKEFVSSISVFNFGDLLANDTAPTAERAGGGNSADSAPVGDSSNGTIHRLCVGKTADVMSFEFRGTGFEILSRTTQDIYAVVSVKVVSNTTGQTVKQFPVITECKGGDLYQVPILAVKGLPLDTYTVTLAAAGGTATKARTLYIDGVRIYQPLKAADQTEYYNASEANAEFYEIKNLIGEGRAWYAEVDSNSGTMVSGSTLIENVEDDGSTLTSITDVNKYLDDGPNNELYLDGTNANSFLALKLKKVEGAEQIMLHIGAHRKASSSEFAMEGDSQSTYLIAGKTAHEVINGQHMVYVSGGTEQYIELAITDADFDENGCCTLFIGTKDEGEGYQALVLTNIKYKGLTIEKTVDDTTTAEQLAAEPLMVEARALAAYYSDPYDPALSIKHTDVLAVRGIFSKKATVTLTVRTTEPLQKIVVTDAAGQVVEVRRYTIGFPGYATTVSAVWQVEAKRGEVLNYTVRAYNADGLSSVNTVEVSAKVK